MHTMNNKWLQKQRGAGWLSLPHIDLNKKSLIVQVFFRSMNVGFFSKCKALYKPCIGILSVQGLQHAGSYTEKWSWSDLSSPSLMCRGVRVHLKYIEKFNWISQSDLRKYCTLKRVHMHECYVCLLQTDVFHSLCCGAFSSGY